MTPKETLYRRILEIRNAIDVANGKEPRHNVEACLKVSKSYCQQRTVAELGKELEIAQLLLRNTVRRKAAEDYWATPEGSARAAEINAQIHALHKDGIAKIEAAADEANRFIKSRLGERWQASCFGDRTMAVGLACDNGLSVNVSLLGCDPHDPGRLEIACPSVSGFDPADSPLPSEFFAGLAELARPETAGGLKAIMKSCAEYCRRNLREISKLNNELQNPNINDQEED